jgi:hypothetical protein
LTDFGDAFAWPTRDPQWIGKLIVVGLIGIIPIVGQVNLLGWTLASLDNLRAGRQELAPANFSHLGRGASLFVVMLVYGLVIVIVAALFYVPGLTLVATTQANGGGAAAGLVLVSVGGLVIFLVSLGYAWLQPIIYLRTDRGGFGAGLDFAAVLAMLRADPLKTLLAALLMYVGGLIGSLGAVVCLVGLVFTIPYGYAIVAGVLRVYEQQVTSAAPQRA